MYVTIGNKSVYIYVTIGNKSVYIYVTIGNKSVYIYVTIGTESVHGELKTQAVSGDGEPYITATPQAFSVPNISRVSMVVYYISVI